jgi:peptidoglycan/xylan/chitin deacetylase (PgdA/CDA1 family)
MSVGRVLFVGSSVVTVAMALALPLVGASSIWPATFVLVAYLAVLLAGVMNPRLAMFAPVVWHAPSNRAEFALTFDDGPDPTSTRKVLASLAHGSVRATFFVLGTKARATPEVLREIAAAGHELGIHGDHHDRLLSLRHPNRIVADLERALAAVESATGRRPRLFRPPLGHVSPRTALAARRLGLTLVGWSAGGRDGLARTTVTRTLRRVIAGLRPGAIILLHDAAEFGDHEPAGVAALQEILQEAARRGLRCVSVSEALGAEASA